jgi:hypothetical protein
MTDLPENELSTVLNRIVKSGDDERLSSMCSLLNTFNYAVQVQSDRNLWEPQDFRAFCIALCAMDEIGQAHHAVEATIESLASRRLKDA